MYVVSQLPHKWVGRARQMVYECVLLGVPVLVDEPFHAVTDVTGVVLYPEFFFPFPPVAFHEALVFAKLSFDIC